MSKNEGRVLEKLVKFLKYPFGGKVRDPKLSLMKILLQSSRSLETLTEPTIECLGMENSTYQSSMIPKDMILWVLKDFKLWFQSAVSALLTVRSQKLSRPTALRLYDDDYVRPSSE